MDYSQTAIRHKTIYARHSSFRGPLTNGCVVSPQSDLGENYSPSDGCAWMPRWNVMSTTLHKKPFQFSLAALLVLVAVIGAELALLPLDGATRAVFEIPIGVFALIAFAWLADGRSTTRLLVVRCMAVAFAFLSSGLAYQSWLENDGWLSIPLDVPYAILVLAHSLIVFTSALRIERAFGLVTCFASSLLMFAAFALQVNFGDVAYTITIARWIDPDHLVWLLRSLGYLYGAFGFREIEMLIPNTAWFAPMVLSWVILVSLALHRRPATTETAEN